MELKRRPDIERFLRSPDKTVRCALIYGPDAGVVRERGAQLAAAATERPDDPFDVALLTDADLDSGGAALEGPGAGVRRGLAGVPLVIALLLVSVFGAGIV